MQPERILIVRSANIGDLLCTTPILRALKNRFPDSRISILVNSYNHQIVEDNPDVDEVLVYEKAKHGHGRVRAWWRVYRLFSDVRRRRGKKSCMKDTGKNSGRNKVAEIKIPCTGRQVVTKLP